MEEVKNIMKKIKQNDVQYLREYFRKYPHKINQTGSTGGTYLMAACVESQTDLISFLIETGAELNLRDKHGRTALYHAVDNRRHDAVALLISKGAKVNIADENGETPLYVAVLNYDEHLVELFLNNKENTSLQVNQEDKHGWTPLHLACWWGQTDIVKLLMPLPGIKINVVEKRFGFTPLHLACVRGQTDIVKLLLPIPGIKINVVDKVYGWTPLHWAVYEERYDVVTLMVSQDSVELDVKDKMERTPLLLAISYGNLGIIHGLIAHGADINAVNGDGNNCLHIAVNSEVKCWHSEVEPIAILNEYCTELELGEECRCTQPVVVSYLAHHGADLYCKNKKNETALDLIKNVDLREKIKSLFPPLHCMFCGKNKPMGKFYQCDHLLTCKECYLKHPLRKCPCCPKLVRDKSVFVGPNLSDKEVQTMEEPVESPRFWQTLLQGVTQWLGGTWQQIVGPKLSDKAVQTMVEPVETPKIEKNVLKVSQPSPSTSSVSQPIESPKLEQKHLHYVANKLGNKGPQVGRELGIQQVDMDIIKSDNPNNTVEQSFQMLYKWFTSCDTEKRSTENLREALKAHDCYEALECLPSDVK